MLPVLGRFEPFAGLGREHLEVIARHARLVDVPSGRWLVRRGRTVIGSHYLVNGTVRTFGPERVIRADDPAARRPIYPGAEGLCTLSDCRLLQLDQDALDLLNARPTAALAVVAESDDCWQSRFLQSALMAALPPRLWQQVLSRLEPVPAESGCHVVVEDAVDALDACFVLARGSATVTAGGRQLCLLEPGDLFGEDALITIRPRNASVTMLENGQVMRLAAPQFQTLLDALCEADLPPEPVTAMGAQAAGRRRLIRFESLDGVRESVGRLDRGLRYLIEADDVATRTFALFLMRKLGLDVRLESSSRR